MREYHIKLPYREAQLDILLFNNADHRWIFTHNYLNRESEKINAKPSLTNKTCLVVDYNNGIVSEIEISMDIKKHDKRGKEYWLGMDISLGSHLFVEFKYEKKGELFKMKTILTGAGNRFDLDSLTESQLPLRPFEFPFPLKDRIENEHGIYKVPFLTNSNVESFFDFPAGYSK